jgi:hypothetical protein
LIEKMAKQDEGLIRVVRGQWKGHVSTTKTGVARSVPLVPELGWCFAIIGRCWWPSSIRG